MNPGRLPFGAFNLISHSIYLIRSMCVCLCVLLFGSHSSTNSLSSSTQIWSFRITFFSRMLYSVVAFVFDIIRKNIIYKIAKMGITVQLTTYRYPIKIVWLKSLFVASMHSIVFFLFCSVFSVFAWQFKSVFCYVVSTKQWTCSIQRKQRSMFIIQMMNCNWAHHKERKAFYVAHDSCWMSEIHLWNSYWVKYPTTTCCIPIFTVFILPLIVISPASYSSIWKYKHLDSFPLSREIHFGATHFNHSVKYFSHIGDVVVIVVMQSQSCPVWLKMFESDKCKIIIFKVGREKIINNSTDSYKR